MNAEQALKTRITDAVTRAVHDPATIAQPQDVMPIASAVIEAVAPQLEHAANAEPWYRSRVTIGAIVSIAIPLLGVAGVSGDVLDADQLTALLMAAGAVIGGITTLYGRWVAKAPIGKR